MSNNHDDVRQALAQQAARRPNEFGTTERRDMSLDGYDGELDSFEVDKGKASAENRPSGPYVAPVEVTLEPLEDMEMLDDVDDDAAMASHPKPEGKGAGSSRPDAPPRVVTPLRRRRRREPEPGVFVKIWRSILGLFGS